jgi:ABC-type glycerol-3-phosphate transport system substrate-binding protein
MKNFGMGSRMGVALRSLFFILVLFLAACDGNKEEKNNDDSTPQLQTRVAAPSATFSKPVTLTLWHPYEGLNATALQTAAENFMENTPGLTVQLEYHAADTLLVDYETAVRQGGGPEILVAQSEWVGELIANRQILPLEKDFENLFGTLLESAVFRSLLYEGELWASPLNADVPLLYYNRDHMILEPRRMEDLLIVVGDEGVLLPENPADLLGLYQPPSGILFDANGQPQIEANALTDYLTLIQTLKNAQYVTFTNDPALFLEGTAAAIIAPASQYNSFTTLLGDKLGIATLPVARDNESWRPLLDLTLLTINSNAPDEAFRAANLLLAYLIDPATQQQLATDGDFLPLIRATTAGDLITRVYLRQLSTAQPTTLDAAFYQTFLPALADLVAQASISDADIATLAQEWSAVP